MNCLRTLSKFSVNFVRPCSLRCRAYGTYLTRNTQIFKVSDLNYNGFKTNNLVKRQFSTEEDLEKEIEKKLKRTIESEKILIFIKGTPEDPQCKYSAKLISILNNYKVNDYAYINVFSHELLRKCVKNVSNWPTFPQLFIRGKLIGGCDIVDELHNSGELEKLF